MTKSKIQLITGSAAIAVALIAVGLTYGSVGASLSVSQLATPQTLRTSGTPAAMAVDAAAGRAYVTDSAENTLFVFDLATGDATAFIPTGLRPGQVVLDGGRAYVSNFADATITVIDTATRHGVETLAAGGLGIAIDTAAHRLFAAEGSRISVIDLATDHRTKTIEAPKGARLWGVAFDPLSGRLFATDVNAARLVVFDGATGAYLRDIPLDAPARLAITAVGGHVYVAGDAANAQLASIDALNGAVLSRTPVAPFVNTLALSAAGTVYAASAPDKSVTAVTTATASIAKAVLPVGGAAIGVDGTGQPLLATTGGGAPPARTSGENLKVVQP